MEHTYTIDEVTLMLKTQAEMLNNVYNMARKSGEQDKLNDMEEDAVGCANHNEPNCVHCKQN